MHIGFTGHQRLADERAWHWVAKTIGDLLYDTPRPLVGVTALAIGADRLFAECVLANRGALRVVVPFPEYERVFDAVARDDYRRLLRNADEVFVLDRWGTDEDCYRAAGRAIVEDSDELIAVWDGLPAGGPGGTGDVVAYALSCGRRVLQVNPVAREVVERPEAAPVGDES